MNRCPTNLLNCISEAQFISALLMQRSHKSPRARPRERSLAVWSWWGKTCTKPPPGSACGVLGHGQKRRWQGEGVTAACLCSSCSWLLQWSFAVEPKLQKGFACPNFYQGPACFWNSLDICFMTTSPHCCGVVLHRKIAVHYNRWWKAEDLFKLSTTFRINSLLT